jgi:hypothetical protein
MFPSVVVGGDEEPDVLVETTMIAVVRTTRPTVPQNQFFR